MLSRRAATTIMRASRPAIRAQPALRASLSSTRILNANENPEIFDPDMVRNHERGLMGEDTDSNRTAATLIPRESKDNIETPTVTGRTSNNDGILANQFTKTKMY